MWAMLEDRVFAQLRSDPALKAKLPRIERAVAEGRISPAVAVDEICAAAGIWHNKSCNKQIVMRKANAPMTIY